MRNTANKIINKSVVILCILLALCKLFISFNLHSLEQYSFCNGIDRPQTLQ